MSPAISSNEGARLQTLARYAILDTAPEASFERITALAARIFATPMAMVTLVDEKRQWFKSCRGISHRGTPRAIAFCAYTILSDDVLVALDTTLDSRFCDNPQVTGEPFMRFYAGAPLVTGEGFRLGSLCVIDTVPRQFSAAQADTLRDLAAVVVEACEARRTSHRMSGEIAERERAEIALRQEKRGAEEARAEAEKANAAKSRFLSRMSHELRTPLNAILGFGQLLEFNATGAQETRAVKSILRGGRHLLALVDEVLDLARVETADFQLSFSHVDVFRLAQECIGLVDRLAAARGVACEVRLAPGMPALLWTDEQRLRQVLLNLLANAIKYNREGGHVVLSGEEFPAGRLRLKVSDTGLGITREGLERLFVPFERLHQAESQVEGTGLGLVISQQIARAMGGSVGVESTAGEGSTFWIELPLLTPSGMTLKPAVRAEPAGPAIGACTSATVLYIEDNASNLEVLQMLLASRCPGWRLEWAEDGRTGLQRAAQVLPDLIVLDLQLPDISGEEVLRRLRGTAALRNIPVVVLSADATSRSREGALFEGADDYISKPFGVDALLERLNRALEKTAGRRQPESAPTLAAADARAA